MLVSVRTWQLVDKAVTGRADTTQSTDVFQVTSASLCATDLHNGVTFPDVCQELVAQTLASAGTLHKARNVHKLYAGWH